MQAPHALTMREAPATLRAHFYVRHLGCCCESCWAAQFKVDELGRGAYVYVGKDATVVLNKDGQVVTAWANSRAGWRNP